MAEAIAILILAAGQSSRMRGRDKLLERIDGVSLLRLQVTRALAVSDTVYVALPPRPHLRYAVLEDLDVQTVPVPDRADGMSASLSAGIAALPPQTPAAMILLADMPELTREDLRTVLAAVNLGSACKVWRGATASGVAGHPIVFRQDLFEALIATSGDTGGRAVVAENAAATVHIPLPANHARTDLDTPEAWTAWRAQRLT